MFLKSALLYQVPGIVHGFGTRIEPVPAPFLPDWESQRPRWKQVHGTNCVEVKTPAQACGDVDAVFSDQTGIPIPVMTADCVPILLAHKEGKRVAAVHAGWRGTRARILANLWKALQERGESPENWVAAIGPSIGPCCYEVSPELADDFAKEFRDYGEDLAVPTFRHLDLPLINAEQLKEIGLEKVDLIRACTRCSLQGAEPKFHSFRREGSGTRQFSIISRVKDPAHCNE